MKTLNKFENALMELINAELVRTAGHGELTEFHFEEPSHPGKVPFISYTYILIVNCAWRIKEHDNIVVGNRDILKKLEEDDDLYAPARNSKADAILEQLITSKTHPLVINAVKADELGSTRIFFNQNVILELFPDQNTGNKDDYHWILYNDDEEKEVVRVRPVAINSIKPAKKYQSNR